MLTRADAAARDIADPLASLRSRFTLPDGVVYLDGNSLGALPATAAQRLATAVQQQWGQGLIRSWNDAGWYNAPAQVAAGIAPLIGADADEDEVVVADSTSVNLFKLLVAALRLRPGRRVVVMSERDFPSDLYIGRSAAELLGGELRLVGTAGDIDAALDDDVAVLALCQVDFRSGAVHDVAELTAAAHRAGALALWDLSHSAGALDVQLRAWDVDLAVGCGYKYLNGGPGAPAYAFAARHHHAGLRNPLPGWFSHSAPFAFAVEHTPAAGAAQLACGTPPILSLLGLAEGVATLDGVSPGALAAKSRALTTLFVDLVTARCPDVELASPPDAVDRGSQVSLRHPEAYPLVQALAARGVIGDYREPDLARFGFAPAYTRFVDVWDAVDALRAVLDTGAHRSPEFARRRPVT